MRPSRIAVACGILAFSAAGVVAGCTFPQVTFGAVTDGGGLGMTELDASEPDTSTFGDDGTVAETSDGLDSGVHTEAAADGACDFNGTWATRITIDVSWQPQGLNSVILQQGTGQIRQYVKGVRTQAGTSLTDDSVLCDIELPDFKSTTQETYGVRFPATLFDDGYLPNFTVFGGLSPIIMDGGSSYSATQTAVLIGLSLTDPASDPWPSVVTTATDPDQDGKPGVTAGAAQGPLLNASSQVSLYSNFPVNIPALPLQQPQRANSLYLAIRQITTVSGVVQNCDFIQGMVSIPAIGSKPAIDSHILGCALADGGDCTTGTASQASFIDNSEPVFTPSGATEFQQIRLKSGATCAEVRAAAFH